MSAIEALGKLIEKYAQINKEVHLKHLNLSSSRLIKNAKGVIDVKILDTDYKNFF